MPLTFDDLSDPMFLQLPIAEQQKARQSLYDDYNKDPAFKQLPLAERQRVLKVDTAGTFAARQAAMGVPPAPTPSVVGPRTLNPITIFREAFGLTRPGEPEVGGPSTVGPNYGPLPGDLAQQTATELGGVHAPMPVTGSPTFEAVRGAANAMLLNDPIMGALTLGAGGAANTAAKGALAFGGLGGIQAGQEAYEQGAGLGPSVAAGIKAGLPQALFGAVTPFGVGTASTLARGVVRPLAVGAGVGFLTAPSGQGLEGAIQGAATMGGLKLGGVALRGVGQGLGAVRNLFSSAERTGADIPAGLTDAVFTMGGEPAPEPGAGILRLPPPIGPAETSASAFEQAAAREANLRQSAYGGRKLAADLAQQQGLQPGAQEFRPPPPIGGLPATVPEGGGIPTGAGLEIRPPSVYVSQPPIRQGPPRVEALPPPTTEGTPALVSAIEKRFGEQAAGPTAEERGILQNMARDPTTAAELRQTARRVLREFPEAPVTAPEAPPAVPKADLTQEAAPTKEQARAIADWLVKHPGASKEEINRFVNLIKESPILGPSRLGVKSTITQAEQQAEAGDIFSRVMDNVGTTGMKVPKGLKPEVGRLIKNGLPPSAFNNKTGKGFDEVASELGMDTNELLDALRQRAQTGIVKPTVMAGQDEMVQAIRGETNPGNLIELLSNTIKDPNSAAAKAAVSRYEELTGTKLGMPEAVHIDQVGDPTLKGVLQDNPQFFGKGPVYKKEYVEAAEALAKKIRPNPNPLDDLELAKKNGTLEAMAGMEPPTFQKTAAGEQGMIPGTEGRNVPQGGLQPGARQTEALTPLEQAATPQTQMPLVGPRGGVDVGGPGNAPTNSLNDDMNNWFDRLKAWGRSFRDTELRTQIKRLSDRTMSMQEMARKYPEMDPAYKAFHQYPGKATTSHTEAIAPLFEKEPGGIGETPYFSLADKQRQAVDDLAMQHKVNRQGQPRMTAAQMKQSRGFTDNMIGAFNDVMDYGKAQLDAMRDWYIERGTPALMKSGMSEDAARASLEAQAAKALQGLDHWVPSYRSGDKTVTVRDMLNGTTAEFRLEPNIKSRVEAVAQLRQKYPDANRFKIEEGTLDNFVRSKAFDEIDVGALEILSRFARVDPTVADEFMTQIRPALLGRSDALSHYKKFENIPGFQTKLGPGLINTGKSTFNYIERQRAFTAATKSMENIDPRNQKEMFNFLTQYIKDNMASGDKKFQTLRDMTYTYILGGNLKQYPLQLSQFMTSVMPEGLKYASPSEMLGAANEARKFTFSRNLTNAPQELQDIWTKAFQERKFMPRAEMYAGKSLQEMMGSDDPFSFMKQFRIEHMMDQQLNSAESKTTQGLKYARNLWMTPITDADMRTRFGAVTFFYDIARNVKHMDIPAAQRFAIDEAERTNFSYGRANSPQLFGRQGLSLYANMFKSWPASQISFLRGLYAEANKEAMATGATSLGGRLGAMGSAALAGPSPARALASSMGAMLALSGVMAQIPGPLLEAFKLGVGVDPETAARKLLTGQLGLPQWGTDVALRGVGSLAGVDLSRSFAIGDTLDLNPANLAGAVPGTLMNLGQGGVQLYKSATQPFGPDRLDALEQMSGGGVKNALKAARLWNDMGIATRYGAKLPGSEQLRAIDPYLQGAGMTPLAVSNAKALQAASKEMEQYHKEQQANMMEKYARAIVNQDQDAVASLNQRIQQNNEDAMAKNRPDLIIKPDRASLRQRVAEMLSPGAALKRAPKNQRQRLMELQDLYLGPPAAPE